jgi:hypothetical protein
VGSKKNVVELMEVKASKTKTLCFTFSTKIPFELHSVCERRRVFDIQTRLL